MLNLSRREQETIVIDERITVVVTVIRGNVVQIGVEAPKEISIRRGELEPRKVA